MHHLYATMVMDEIRKMNGYNCHACLMQITDKNMHSEGCIKEDWHSKTNYARFYDQLSSTTVIELLDRIFIKLNYRKLDIFYDCAIFDYFGGKHKVVDGLINGDTLPDADENMSQMLSCVLAELQQRN